MRLLVERERERERERCKISKLGRDPEGQIFMLETAIKRDGKSPANMKEILWIGLKNLDEFIDGGMYRLCLRCITKYTVIQQQFYWRTGRCQNFERSKLQFKYE